ncbi:MAG TPA: hypothetical protein VM099_03620 [Gemmatimonadaceae bacterium]|nr:hypothetical protein [Gemmatimonadaceae bacterium]
MTARDRVIRTRRQLLAGVGASAIAWGAGVTLASFAIFAFVASWPRSPKFISEYALLLSLLFGVMVGGIVLWRARRLMSDGRVALWLEEKLPALHYALVTAIDPELQVDSSSLESAVARQDIGGVTTNAIQRSVVPAFGALVLGAALLYVLPSDAFGRAALLGRIAGANGARGIPAGSRLNDLRVEVIPPGYSGQRRQQLDDPESVRALVGSTVLVTGVGSQEGVQARVGVAVLSVDGSRSSWRAQFVMPGKPAPLTLTDRSYERIIVLDPQVDEAPKVVLVTPVRDTTLRTPQLVVNLHSELTDDVALSSGYYEYLITSGAGEVFSGRTITTPPKEFGGARSGSLDASLDLKSLKLAQGDVISIRAIVRDANTLSGPSIGTSDTRTIRIARADEYDSVSIEAAAPPPVDSSAMSQRMLVLMTEALVKKEKTLSHAEWVKQSTDIGMMEDRIRKRVYDILYQTESQDEASDTEEQETGTEMLANKDLKEAYDNLWTAVRSLQIAEPKPALPPMRVALAALDRARLAQRLYLRGMPPKIVVDLQRVRLTGKDHGAANSRTPRSFADSARVRLSSRFNAALELIARQPSRAITELALMRVDALTSAPDFAAPLAEAIEAMRSGRDATLFLIRARRALDGSPEATPGLPLWAGGG